MAAGGPRPREISGVADGLGIIIRRVRAQEQPPPLQTFIAANVKGGEAGALLALLALDLPGGYLLGGQIRNGVAMEAADRAFHIVELVKDHVLHDLARQPTAHAVLVVLDACARRLRVHATAAGGSFGVRATGFAALLDAYVVQAHGHPQYDDYRLLRASIDDIRRSATRLQHASLTVRDLDPAPQAAAEEEEQAAMEEDAAADEAAVEEDEAAQGLD